ncbi:MAG: hypothetical protein US69_C0001G0012 [candidate division TM6 bacterium GW2011_GWF2_38_10]|nr:MAG: hypothetical protein US69_C0001G0012 [candidate division TM6 bacterium GW2011_GWF2_38_10]
MKNEKKCKRFFWISSQQIDTLIKRLEPFLREYKNARLSRFNRKKALGGGRQFDPDALKTMLRLSFVLQVVSNTRICYPHFYR